MDNSLCAHCTHCDEVKYDGFMCDKTGYVENKEIEDDCKYFESDAFATIRERRGHWVTDTWCSECGRFPVDCSLPISNRELTKYFEYCPHCGIKMEHLNRR